MRIASWLDQFSTFIGQSIKWLALFMLLLQFTIVILRYAFGVNFIAMQELVLYLHASLFMIAAAYTLKIDGHVRVDIFYALLTPRKKAIIDIVGHLIFLLPGMFVILYYTWPSVRNAWAIREGAISVGGLPASFLLKTLIPIFCILLILQSVSCLIRNVGIVLKGQENGE